MINNSFKANSYKRELDGLRAIALIAVIAYHFNEKFLESGFLGVDIFFVISGYVISYSVETKIKSIKNIPSFFFNFYWRRIIRLLPALIFYVFTMSILLSLFNPAPERFILSGITSLIGISNLYFFNQSTDYFAGNVDFNPFLQTWSLGVEQQFYVFFPFLILFSGYLKQTRNSYRNLFTINLLLFSISLFIFLFFHINNNQTASYFLMPSRLWEISAGSILFIISNINQNLFRNLRKIPTLLIITFIVLTFYSPIDHVVISTIIIVSLTSILIICIKEEDIAYKVLTLKGINFLGRYSYSLYLWHWGVLTISKWTIGVFWWTIPFQIILTLIFGITSNKFIEDPIRKSIFFKKGLKPFLIIFSSLALSILILIFGIYSSFKNILFRGSENKFGIFDYPKKGYFKKTNNKSDKNLIVLGDSFAGHLLTLFKEVSDEYNFNLMLHTNRNGFKKDFTKEGNYKYLYYSLKDYSSDFKKNDILFISLGQINETKSISKQKDFHKLTNLIDDLKIKTVFIGPTPVFREGLYSICQEEWFRPAFSIKEECSPNPRVKIQQDLSFYNNFLYDLSSKSKNIYIFDAFNVLCPGKFLYCPLKDGENYIYYDEHHLTSFGSLLLKNELINFLKRKEILKISYSDISK